MLDEVPISFLKSNSAVLEGLRVLPKFKNCLGFFNNHQRDVFVDIGMQHIEPIMLTTWKSEVKWETCCFTNASNTKRRRREQFESNLQKFLTLKVKHAQNTDYEATIVNYLWKVKNHKTWAKYEKLKISENYDIKKIVPILTGNFSQN